MENNKIQFFENKKVRTVWDAEQEKWLMCQCNRCY
jgi:hypothetical protein